MQLPDSFAARAARSLGGPEWLAARRLAALGKFAASPPPVVEEDLWRYSRISELDLEQYVPSGTGAMTGLRPTLEADAWPQSAALLDHVGERSGLAVVVDGALVSSELSEAASATGAVLGSVLDDLRGSEVLDQVMRLNSAAGKEEHTPDVFDLLADAFLRDAVVLSVPARAPRRSPDSHRAPARFARSGRASSGCLRAVR